MAINQKREQLKNEIQFILNSFTQNGTRTFSGKHIYRAYREKVLDSIMLKIEEYLGKI
jgi:chemotaxis methyl-accepting protein methylase